MNIAIIGRNEILFKTAQMLSDRGHNISLIITAKAAPEYKKKASDFEQLAQTLGAEFIYAPNIQAVDLLTVFDDGINMDIGVSINYPNILSTELISLFPLGILNAHNGDLPRYKGNACIAWAILNGEKKAGVCIHKMMGGQLDSGDIILKDYLDLEGGATITQVMNWSYEKIPQMFVSALNKLSLDRNYITEKQSLEPKDSLRCYPLKPEDGKLDWNQSAEQNWRKVRAFCDPYSGAFCLYNNITVHVWSAEIVMDQEPFCAIPGQITNISISNGSVDVACSDRKLRIHKISIDNETIRKEPASILKSRRDRFS